MKIFCHECGTQAIDDESSFCNNCGTRLIPFIIKNNEHCPKCGAQLPEKDPFFCLQCGSPLAATNSKATPVSPGIGDKPYTGETRHPKSPKPLKRTSIVLPALLFFIAFVLVIVMIFPTGLVDLLSPLTSSPAAQEQALVPANGTPMPTSPMTAGTPTPQTTMKSAKKISTPTPIPTPLVTTGAPPSQSALKNIVETAEADGRFTTFVVAAKAAGLDDTISGDTLTDPTMFTVFAPTDDAFNALSEGSMEYFLNDPKGALLQILLYHVVQGKVTSADLRELSSVETLQGGFLPISNSNGVVTVDGANVIITDMECSNGVIHGVDTVMLPPA